MLNSLLPTPELNSQLAERIYPLLNGWHKRTNITIQQRQLPEATLAELHEADLLQILLPRHHGGLGLTWPDLMQAARITARACASTGWAVGVIGGHVLHATRLPDPCQAVLFSTGPKQVFSTGSVAEGSIKQVADGFLVNGLWRFASCIDHATWLMVKANCLDLHGQLLPERVMVVIRPEQVEIRDNWRVYGMEGTGSKDIYCNQVLVKAEMTCSFPSLLGGRPELAAGVKSYLECVPLLPYLSCGLLGPILGCTEGAFQDAVLLLEKRSDNPFNMSATNRALMLERLALASAELAAAQRLFSDLVQTLHKFGLLHQSLDAETARRMNRDRAYLVHLCVSVVERLVRELKTSALFEQHPVQQRWQDIQAMASHIDVNWDNAMIDYGSYLLGKKADGSPLAQKNTEPPKVSA